MNYEVWVLDRDTRRWTPLTGFAGQVRVGLPSGLDWSPDGQSIAVSGAGGSVYVVHP